MEESILFFSRGEDRIEEWILTMFELNMELVRKNSSCGWKRILAQVMSHDDDDSSWNII